MNHSEIVSWLWGVAGLKWKQLEAAPDGDFFVRSGPGTVKLPPDSAKEYVGTRFAVAGREQKS